MAITSGFGPENGGSIPSASAINQNKLNAK